MDRCCSVAEREKEALLVVRRRLCPHDCVSNDEEVLRRQSWKEWLVLGTPRKGAGGRKVVCALQPREEEELPTTAKAAATLHDQRPTRQLGRNERDTNHKEVEGRGRIMVMIVLWRAGDDSSCSTLRWLILIRPHHAWGTYVPAAVGREEDDEVANEKPGPNTSTTTHGQSSVDWERVSRKIFFVLVKSHNIDWSTDCTSSGSPSRTQQCHNR